MKILEYPHPALTDKEFCKPVTDFNETLKNQLDSMWQVMLDGKGIGLAANQVGIPIRAFVMAYMPSGVKNWDPSLIQRLDVINPVIEPILEEGFQNLNEGCLSLPEEFLQVSRYQTVKLTFQDLQGETHQVIITGLESVCAQHELDHLNGIFFLDKVSRNVRRAVLRKRGS